MPLSGLLAEYDWPLIFYVFGFVGVVWSLFFLKTVYEDPQSNPKISESEKNYINTAIWGTDTTVDRSPEIPWKFVLTSVPFYAILFAHVSNNSKRSYYENYFFNFFTFRWLKITDMNF